jgi:hypothetical protein
MLPFRIIAGLALLAAPPARDPGAAADIVTLTSGKVIRGEIVEQAHRSLVTMIVRREWAERALPELLKAWEKDEEATTGRARSLRIERLEAWKRDRAGHGGAGDRIGGWIDRELARLNEKENGPRTPLVIVQVGKSEIRDVTEGVKGKERLVRLGWQCKFPDTETMTVDELTIALEERGFDLAKQAPVKIDDLLPLTLESDNQWLLRRAATEVTYDAGVRFIEIGPMLLPDFTPNAGGAAPRGFVPPFGDPGRTRGGRGNNPLASALRAIGGHGGVGAVVTSQQTDFDRSRATVVVTLWVRGPRSGWMAQKPSSATVAAADVKDADLQGPGGPQQFAMSFSFSQMNGFGNGVNRQVKRSNPKLGAAARLAAENARAAFDDEITGLALKID